jgi:hypothetical protein
MATTRAGNIFTTHTPVPAGFDRFPSALMDLFLRRYAEDRLGIALDALLALARENPNDPGEPFNMAYLAVSGSAAVKAHGILWQRSCAWRRHRAPQGANETCDFVRSSEADRRLLELRRSYEPYISGLARTLMMPTPSWWHQHVRDNWQVGPKGGGTHL